MSLWTDDQLNQWALDAEQQINQDVSCIFTRFFLPLTIGNSTYTFPSYVRSVTRITWRGREIYSVNWEDLTNLAPATAWIGPGNPDNVEYTVSRPIYYAFHPTNVYDIRFHPTPDETALTTGDPYSPDFSARCIVSCYRSIDSTLVDPLAMLPTYIDRRTRKAYVCWKAFEADGKGQNLKAATYFKAKYQFLISQFQKINGQPFISKRYAMGDGQLEVDNFRMPRPMLPSNFERIFY